MLDQDYTYQFGEAGLLINGESTLPFVDVKNIAGMDVPPVRLTERTRPGTDGGYLTAEYTEMRTVVIEADVYAEPTEVERYLDDLKSNFAPSRFDQPLFVRNTEFERVLYCKCIGFKYDLAQVTRLGIVPVQIQLKAADPAFYGNLINLTLAIASEESNIGRGYPRTYPLSFGGAIPPTTLSVTNSGNKDTGGILRIHGPVRNPVVYLRDTTSNEGGFHLIMTIGLGEWVDINTNNRTVLLNGTANRRGRLTTTSQWFKFPRGNSTLQFTGERIDSDNAPMLEVFFRPAWR